MANHESDTSQETQETETEQQSPAPSGMTAEDFNKAFSAREKALLGKLEKKLQAMQPPTSNADDSETKPNKAPTSETEQLLKKIEKQERALKDLQKSEQQARLTAKKTKLENDLTKALKDKVSADWLDIAVEKLASNASLDGDSAELVFDELSYSVSEGVTKWLEQPQNKRFLPSKASAQRTPQQTLQTIKANGGDVSKADAEARWAAAFDQFIK